MSTIRWVDLLSSESNFSYSIANNDDINEKKKKNKINNKENDLNNSFLNSYNGDLDNSNVGINLKIKNMCIKDNKAKNEEFFDCQTDIDDNSSKTIKNDKKGNIKNESENFKKISNNKVLHANNNTNENTLDNDINYKTNNINSEEQVSSSDVNKINCGNDRNNNKINLEKNDKINEKKENKDLNFYFNKSSNNASKNNNNNDNNKNNNNNNANNNTKVCKKKNSSNSSDFKANKNKKIINVPLDKKTIKNSFFSKYILEKNENKIDPNNDNTDSISTLKNEKEKETTKKDTKKYNLINNLEINNSNTIVKCKKRKERNLNIDNSISKGDYSQSCEITLDDNNIPLNPTKKLRNKLKEIKENMNDNKKNRNDDIIISNDLNGNNEAKTKLKCLENTEKVVLKEENKSNNNFKKIEENNNVIDPFNNLVNKNINLEKFNNFNNNFINYIGDIRNNFNEALNNVNSNRVSSRLKEIAVGKSTKEYKNYVKLVKYDERMEDDPSTPNAYENITNAKFQAKYNLWRKKLHKFDSIN